MQNLLNSYLYEFYSFKIRNNEQLGGMEGYEKRSIAESREDSPKLCIEAWRGIMEIVPVVLLAFSAFVRCSGCSCSILIVRRCHGILVRSRH